MAEPETLKLFYKHKDCYLPDLDSAILAAAEKLGYRMISEDYSKITEVRYLIFEKEVKDGEE